METVQPATLYNDSSTAAFSSSSALGLSRPHTFASIDGGSQISVDVAASVISTEDRPQTEQGNARYDWNNANPNKQQPARDRRPSGAETRLESALFRDIHLDRLELPSAESVKESAMGLFKALEKETKNAVLSKDSSGEGASRDMDPGNVPSFIDIIRASGDEERLILRELLRAGLERLGEHQSAGSSKQRSRKGSSDRGSSQCLFDKPFVCSHEGCNKRTRRQCEMRYFLSS